MPSNKEFNVQRLESRSHPRIGSDWKYIAVNRKKRQALRTAKAWALAGFTVRVTDGNGFVIWQR